MADALADARRAIAEARLRFEAALLRAQSVEGQVRAQVRRRPFFSLSQLERHDAFIAQLRDSDLPAANAAAQEAMDALDAAHTAYDEAAEVTSPVWEEDTADPVLLLPMRLETKYKVVDDEDTQLWIRAYPDDVHVDGHEPGFTANERSAADDYAAAVAAAADDDARLAAWRLLVAALGLRRAAWVTEVLRREAAGEPTAEPRDAAWTRAARARLLPERLVFSGYRHGRLVWRVEGEPIPPDVDIGLAPPDRATDEDRDRDGPWHEAAAWLVDFDKAVERGLGVRVPMTEPDLAFDRVTVLGVAREDGAQAVQDLLDAHTYTDGLAVLPAGTPTNNTPESRAAWRSRPEPRTPDEVDRQRTAYEPESLQPVALLAAVLGVDGARALALAPDALDSEGVRLAMLANAAVAHVMSTSNDWMPFDETSRPDLSDLVAHMGTYVRSRGPLPMLRIGRQPYGVLPATALDLWRGSGFEDNLALVLRSVQTAYAERASRLPQVGTGPDQIATILDVLSRRPASRRVVIDRTDGPGSDQVPPPPTVGIVNHTMRFGVRWPSSAGREHLAADPPAAELQQLVQQRPLSAWLGLIDRAVEITLATPEGQEPDFSSLQQEFDDLRGALGPALETSTSGVTLPIYVPILFASFVFAPAAARARQAVENGASPDDPGVAFGLWLSGPLDAIRDDVRQLEDEAVADLGRVERALCEAIDLTAYRLDAWVTSLATARLDLVRSELSPTGLRTGAYGWLHDVRPEEPSLRFGSDGYVVAPSMHHATTAAVLRSGWLGTTEQAPLAVDLRSSRVRKALGLLDGARSGQVLGALLGYRFERGLHERRLDGLIDDFRAVFPLAPQVEPDAPDDQLEEARAAVAARNVVDGQALRQAFAAGETGVALGEVDAEKVREIVADLDDSVDALGDLLLAESVHHLVGGTPLRAGLSADAIGRGEGVPQELDVVTTPRSARLVTYVAGALVAPSGVTGWAATALAALEPGLEQWCAARLGPAADWVVRATPDGAPFGLDALGVSALETVLGSTPDGPVLRRLARAAGVATVSSDDPRLGELQALCGRLREVLATAVPLDAGHLDPLTGPGLVAADLGELAGRVNDWLAVVSTGTEALRDADDDAARTAALDVLAAAGVASAAPAGPGDDLTVRAADVLARLTTVAPPATLPAPPSGDALTPPAVLAWHAAATSVVRAVAGDGLLLMPELRLSGSEAGRTLIDDNRPAGTDADAVADTVRDLGRVRPLVRTLDDALLGAEVLTGREPPTWIVAQAPATANAPWVAVAASPARACALLTADATLDLNPASAASFCDQWTEKLPEGGPDEVAAVAIHHDRPDARAPHTMLVAVPPDAGRGWRMEDLHAVVDDTFELARLRALDPVDLPDLGGVFPPDPIFAGIDL